MNYNAIVSLSGGMDSATLLQYVRDKGLNPLCIGFQYGSKHNQYEIDAAHKLAEHYSVDYQMLDLEVVFKDIKSNLLKSGEAIPEGHYNEPSMSQTVVPGRNIIFASILAGKAWSLEISKVFLGIHAGDHHIYPDCRPNFFFSMAMALGHGTEEKVKLRAPFLYWTKSEILTYGLKHKVPYQLTRTCYKQQEVACGLCGSCRERLEAFQLNNANDPIPYES
jgi:7-cyano-7-deazaguanine synthase